MDGDEEVTAVAGGDGFIGRESNGSGGGVGPFFFPLGYKIDISNQVCQIKPALLFSYLLTSF